MRAVNFNGLRVNMRMDRTKAMGFSTVNPVRATLHRENITPPHIEAWDSAYF